MIHLQITSSPDKDVEMSFRFQQNEIYLGTSVLANSSGNLQVKDPELKPIHLMVEVVEQDLIVHPQKGVEAYLIDGKRASTIRKIRAQQAITIGKTTFKVLEFAATELPSKKAILDEKLAKLVETNSSRLSVIEKLAKLMK